MKKALLGLITMGITLIYIIIMVITNRSVGSICFICFLVGMAWSIGIPLFLTRRKEKLNFKPMMMLLILLPIVIGSVFVMIDASFNAYFAILGLMAISVVIMILYKKKCK